MTRIQVKPEPLDRLKTEATAIFLFEDAKKEKLRDSMDKKLGGRISSLIRKKRYTPKKFSTRSIDTLGKMKSETILLMGLGKKGDLTPDIMRRAAAKAALTLRSLGVRNFSLTVEGVGKGSKLSDTLLAQAAAEGILLSLYRFTEYRKKPQNDNSKIDIDYAVLSQKKSLAKVKASVSAAQKLCKSVFLARDLQNHPGNKIGRAHV